MQKLVPGFNDISNDDYHADREYISSSGLKLLLKDGEAFYRKYVLNQEEGSKNSSALDFGSYLHCLILEPHLVDDEFAIYDGYQRRGKDYQALVDQNPGKIIITKSVDQKVRELVDAFNKETVKLEMEGEVKDVRLASFFEDGYPEQALAGEIDGVKVKIKTDYRREFEHFGSINDLKTTSDYIGTKQQVEKICATWMYDLSAALYVDLAKQVTGKHHDFYFCFVSKKPDALVKAKMYKASDQMIASGRKKYREALRLLKEARETGTFFKHEIQEIDSIEL